MKTHAAIQAALGRNDLGLPKKSFAMKLTQAMKPSERPKPKEGVEYNYRVCCSTGWIAGRGIRHVV